MDPEQNPTEPEEQLPTTPPPRGSSMAEKAKGLGGNLINKALSSKTGGKIGGSKSAGGKGETAGGKTPMGGGGKKGPTEKKIDRAAGKTAGTGVKAALIATGVGATVAQAAGKATDWLVRKVGTKRLVIGYIVVTLIPLVIIGTIVVWFLNNPLSFLRNVSAKAGVDLLTKPIGIQVLKLAKDYALSENNKSTHQVKLAFASQGFEISNVSWGNDFNQQGLSTIILIVKTDDGREFPFIQNDPDAPYSKRYYTYTYQEASMEGGFAKGTQIKVDYCQPEKGTYVSNDGSTTPIDISNDQLFKDAYAEEIGADSQLAFGVCNTTGGQAGAGAAGSQSNPDSLANTTSFKELLGKINWKEAQYQYGKRESLYTLKTSGDGKQILAFVARDGKEIAPTDISNQSQEVQNAIADSMNALIPIKEILTRGPQLRKINKASDVKLAYAAPEESKVFSGKDNQQANRAEYDKTLGKVHDPLIKPIEFIDTPGDPEYEKIKTTIQNVEEKIKNGTPPQEIDISKDVNLPTGLDKDSVETRAKSMCYFYSVLLDPVNLKNAIENRANAARRNDTKYLTYADTQLYRKVSPEETNAVFNQVADWASSTAYQNTVNGNSANNKGEQIDPDARQQTPISVDTNIDTNSETIKSISSNCAENKKYNEEHGGTGFNFSGNNLNLFGPFAQILSLFGLGNSDKPSKGANKVNELFSDLRKEIFDNSNPYYQNAGFADPTKVPVNDIIVKSIYIASGGSVTGVEDGPQNFNRQTSGMRQLYNDYLQGIGGRFLTPGEDQQLQMAIESTKRYSEAKMGIAYRLFSKENIRSVASTIGSNFTLVRPATAMKRVASTIANLANPIQSLASMYDSISYYGFGKNNTALAASDQNYFMLSPIGFNLDKLNQTDLLANATEIENKAKNDPEAKKKFASWDKCMTEKITSPYYLDDDYLNVKKVTKVHVPIINTDVTKEEDVVPPETQKLYRESCRPFLSSTDQLKQYSITPDDDAEKYRIYTASIYILKGLVNLSDPKTKLDISDTVSGGLEGIQFPPNLGPANELGYYQMPDPTNDEYVLSSCPARRFGSKELIGVIYTVALNWKNKYPNSRLRVGDLNATGHKSHRWGVAADITVTDGSAAIIGTTEGSVELGKMFVNTGIIKNIWFDDTSIDSQIRDYANSIGKPINIQAIGGHGTHFHVDIQDQFRGPESTPGC